MKTSCAKLYGVWSIALVAVASGCNPKIDITLPPAPTYQLAADEVAWQGYQPSQELRFGRAGTTKVRTFRVLDVQDKIDSQASSSLISPRGNYQTITVLGQRTDSLIYVFRSKNDSIPAVDTFLELYKYYDKSTNTVELRAEVEWSKSFSHSLPLGAVTTNQAIQDPDVALLPSVVLGGIAYGPTLRVTSQVAASGASPRLRIIRRIYYAKGKGVVAYEEVGTGLWYRLP